MTSSDLIVNDVYIDPNDSNRVLLATDRGGVQVSTDAAKTFAASNEGFSQRKVAALLVDRDNPSHLYAGVVNDKSFGGVFTSTDQGKSWEQLAVGLEGRDVFTLSQTKDGTVIAGTGHGIFLLDPPANPDHAASPASSTLTWEPRNLIANTVMKVTTQTVRRTKVNVEKPVKAPQVQLDSRVNALDVSGDIWFAASTLGLLTSRDQGASWQGGPVLGMGEYISVASHDQVMVAARVNGVVVSRDGGSSWWPIGLPTMITRIRSILFDSTGTLWLAAREGVFFSKDDGKTWLWIGRLPFRDVDDVGYDAGQHRVLVSSRGSDEVFSIEPKSMTWTFWHSGFRMELIRVAGDRLVAASLDDGVLLGPSAKVEAKQ
jgi:ligand-binding sensor domain-containing protein